MRFPGLPRLPVSRRRHDELAELVCAYNRIASEDLAEYKRRARKAEARVAELEQAIREHRDHQFPEGSHDAVQRFKQAMAVNRRLWSVLDGHDRQEADSLPQHGVVTGGNEDIRHPRTGRWSRGERARDWLTGGSFKGVRRER